MSADQPLRPAASTIVARNYLPAARVLAASYLRHHPGDGFTVLVVDALPGELEDESEVRIITPSDLDLDPEDFGRMATAYTAIELCTAVKPWLLRLLLTEHDVAIYLDPDIEAYSPFADELATFARGHGIVLTPHVLAPVPRDGLRPSESDLMLSGVFNLGFIAVSRDAGEFLQAWQTRLRQDAIVSPSEQLFFDQRWVDNVPAMFSHHVIADPGYNVAYWNMHQRPVERRADGTITAAGSPLRFMHYSGYRPEKPWLISVHYADVPRVVLSEHPVLAELFSDYKRKLMDAGYGESVDSIPYRWAALPDGTKLPLELRRSFREAWLRAERNGTEPPHGAFGPAGAADFLAWAATPGDHDQERAGLNPWAMALWRGSDELQAHFPRPLHDSASAFRLWCASVGVEDNALPHGVVPERREAGYVKIRDSLGVNLLGYLTTESGVGELGRLVHDSIAGSGLQYAISVEEASVANRTGHPIADDVLREPEFGVSVACVNADMTPYTLFVHQELARDRYVIGVWGWEVSEFPHTMHEAFSYVDEIWTYSDFCVDAIRTHSPVPVHRFPIPVRDPIEPGRGWRREEGPTRFLFVFDHSSVFERKNPNATIAAFQRAFGDREDVALVVKTINGDRHPGDRERLRSAAAGDNRIELIERYLDRDEVAKLFAGADCYVSLHRSEGFGLTVAEAMAHGLPVISTDYSSTAEFVNSDVGWPVPYTLVKVGHENPPYPSNAVWAEADIEAAAAAMRQVADDPGEARRRGEQAREHILRTRSFGAAAEFVRERVTAAHQAWLARGRTARIAHDPRAPGPVAAVMEARHALAWPIDVSAPSRMPLAPMLRRAVARALDHHDNHQRKVLAALLDAMENSVRELVERVEKVEEQLTSAHMNSIATSAERIDALDRKVIDLLRERDERLGRAEQAIIDVRDALTKRLPSVQDGLVGLHEVVHPPPEQTVGVTTDVGVLRLPATDTVMLPWLREYGSWEETEARLIDILLAPGSTFVDIGAHVGYYTVRALRRVGGQGVVVSVEPSAEVRALLEYNVKANIPAGSAAGLQVLPNAAWDADVPLDIHAPTDGNTADSRVSASGEAAVDGVRLDGIELLANRDIDVVKCDAQGSDHRALSGMSGLFAKRQPDILCEFDPAAITAAGDDPTEVLDLYRSWNYVPVVVTNDVVNAVATDGARRFLANPPANEEIVALAHDRPEGFVSLWLRPASDV